MATIPPPKPIIPLQSNPHPVEKPMRDHSDTGSTDAMSGEAARQSLKGDKELNKSMPLSLNDLAKKIIPTPETGD